MDAVDTEEVSVFKPIFIYIHELSETDWGSISRPKLEIEQKYVNLKQNGSSIVYGLYIMCLGSSGKPKTKEIES